MKIEQSILVDELRGLTLQAKEDVLKFKSYTPEHLNHKANAEDWSILECIEHLCLYGKFYLPEIENRILPADLAENTYFKSGLLGNYFVNMIKASNSKKMKTGQEMNAIGSELNMSTLDQFLKQLEWLDSILLRSSKNDLTKVKTSISISKMIKLRLGDTLRFVVHHNERHILQAKSVAFPPR